MGKHTQITEATSDTAPNGSLFYDTDAAAPPTAITQTQADGWYVNRLSSSTDNAIARFDGTGGSLQNSSNVTIDDNGQLSLSGVNQLRVGEQAPQTDGVLAATLNNNAMIYLFPSGTGVAGRIRSWVSSGTTDAGRTAVGSNRLLLSLDARGWSGSNYRGGATIELSTDDDGGSYTYNDTSMPGKISFSTVPNGSVSGVERMKISSTGRVTLGAVGSTGGLEFGSSGPIMMAGSDAPTTGVAAPIGSQYRQTSANSTYGNLVGLLWIKTGANSVAWEPNLEGRWVQYTPTITSLGGSGLTTSSAVGRFTRIGSLVHLRVFIVVSAVGTATGSIIFTLPTNINAAADQMGYGRQDSGTGAMLQVRRLSADATKAEIWKYDNTSPIAVQTNIVHYTYEVA